MQFSQYCHQEQPTSVSSNGPREQGTGHLQLGENPQPDAAEESGSGDQMSALYPQHLRAGLGAREGESAGKARGNGEIVGNLWTAGSTYHPLLPFWGNLLAMTTEQNHVQILMTECIRA